MKFLSFLLVTFLVTFTSFSQYPAEHLIQSDGQEMLLLEGALTQDEMENLTVVNLESKNVFSPNAFFVVNFDDADRRILKSADSIKVHFQKDSLTVSKLEDVMFKNPGPDGIIKAKITPYRDGKMVSLNSNSNGALKIAFLKAEPREILITNDKVVFGILMLILGFVFWTSSKKGGFWNKFYKIIPALFLCYFLPGVLSTTGLISGDESNLYHMASRYLLPASLILLMINIDIKGLIGLGSKSLIMFFTGTIGVVIGGVFAVWIFSMISPATVGGLESEATWRGLATLAGSWIGGGANQTAMYELYGYKETLYGGMIIVDIVVANLWMAIILFGISKRKKIDKWLKADTKAIEDLTVKMENYEKSIKKNPELKDYIIMLGITFAGVGLAHFAGNMLADFFAGIVDKPDESTLASKFFWMIVLSSFFGLALSFTKAKKYEGVGASKVGSVFLYVLVATIGMKMDLTKIFDNPYLIFVGIVWIAFHAGLLILVAKLIRAPYFFLAVGSQANIGGAASAPIVANAFHPALTSVGVIMAVVGYFVGTFGAWLCAEMMAKVAPVIPL